MVTKQSPTHLQTIHNTQVVSWCATVAYSNVVSGTELLLPQIASMPVSSPRKKKLELMGMNSVRLKRGYIASHMR